MTTAERVIRTVPLAELVEDTAVYPRHAVDEQHVASLVYALQSGAQLPPIVAELREDGKPARIVDGWHRARAWRRVSGPEAAVDVELRRYADERELLLDAVALNAAHGRRLDRLDQTRAVLLLQRADATNLQISCVLHIPAERITRLTIRLANAPAGSEGTIPGTSQIALKRPAAHLAGRELTPEQMAAHRRAPGTSYLLIARQLREAISAGLLDPEDQRLSSEIDRLVTAWEQYKRKRE